MKRVNEIDIIFGYNFQQKEMIDCFEALNALPRRDCRRLIQRIKTRKSLASIESENNTLARALKDKYSGNIFAPGAVLPPFIMDDLNDNQILYYLIFNNDEKSDKNRMEAIVREFCPPLPSDHPTRIEKLLNVMTYKEALKLYLILPRGAITSQDLTARSKLRPFILDFVEDAFDLLRMSR